MTSPNNQRIGVNQPTGSAKRRRKPRPTNVILQTGLQIWSGDVREEYLFGLQNWDQAFRVYSEMVDDGVIGGMLEAIKTPLLGSKFQIVAGSTKLQDQKLAEWVRDDLMKLLDIEWIQHVEDMLEFLDFGFALSEKKLTKRPDGKLHYDTLLTVGQETLDRWGPIDQKGNITAFVQRTDLPPSGYIDKDGKLVYQSGPPVSRVAPMSKLCHFTFRGRKNNPQGRSLLRSLYRPWYFKKNLETLEAIGVERDVGNAPVAKVSPEIRPTPQQIANLEKALEGFRQDENLFVILPPGFELEAYGGGNKVYDVRAIIKDYQHIIRQRFFADFLSLGSEQVGSQALASEMTTFFGIASRAIQERMLSVWNRQLIPYLMRWNNLEEPNVSYPVVQWLNPGEQNVQALAQSYQVLVDAGLLDKDAELLERIQLQLGMRAKSLEDTRKFLAKQEKEKKEGNEKQQANGQVPAPVQKGPSNNPAGPAGEKGIQSQNEEVDPARVFELSS